MKKKTNLLSFESYSLLYVLFLTFYGVLFCKTFAFYAVTGRRLLWFILTQLLLGGMLYMSTVRRARRWSTLMACTLFPCLFYEIHSLSGMDAVAGIKHMTFGAALLGGLLCASVQTWLCRQNRIFWLRKVLLTTVILWTVLLLPGCVRAHTLHAEALTAAFTAAETAEEALPEQLSTLDTAWDTYSQSEKMEVLARLLAAECRYLGMQHVPTLMAADLPTAPETVLGQYFAATHTIRISKKALAHEDGWFMAEVLLHETRHAYQQELQQVYDTVAHRYRTLALFADAGIYKAESEHYILPDGTAEGYAAYRDQLTERDAAAYAEARVSYYQSLDT